MAKARQRENAGGPWYRDRFSGLAQTRKVEVVDASVTDFATELALVVIAAAAPATAIAVADDQPALDLVAVALAVDARQDRKSTSLNSSHSCASRIPSSARKKTAYT